MDPILSLHIILAAEVSRLTWRRPVRAAEKVRDVGMIQAQDFFHTATNLQWIQPDSPIRIFARGSATSSMQFCGVIIGWRL